MPDAELERLWQRLRPLSFDKMPLSVPPPLGGRFGSPLVLSRVHCARPEMVVEVGYVEWTLTVCLSGEREDKPANEVRRDPPFDELG
jgi:ATP-dependent DNA ligase